MHKYSTNVEYMMTNEHNTWLLHEINFSTTSIEDTQLLSLIHIEIRDKLWIRRNNFVVSLSFEHFVINYSNLLTVKHLQIELMNNNISPSAQLFCLAMHAIVFRTEWRIYSARENRSIEYNALDCVWHISWDVCGLFLILFQTFKYLQLDRR